MDGQPDHKIGPGETVQITFDTPGEYKYVCTLHPRDMSGTVIVVAD
jgi:plastocyanin